MDNQVSGPLAGLVVADFSRVLAGPYCTMMLADLGALVIKVESPRGDDTRSWRPPERDGESSYFISVNRNKYSIALDLADSAELAIARRIAARADVFIENFKPGGLVRFGLDYETLSSQRPELVYASITGFGSKAGRDLPGYDLLAQASSGLMDVTGEADGEPHKVGVALVDVIAGLHAATGILAALRQRDETGRGDHLEVNLLSSALSALVNQTSAVAAAGVTPHRMGNAHPSLYPYEPFPTANGDIVIAVGNDGQFARLAACLGAPELADDERYATMPARNANRDELCAALVKLLSARTSEEWFAIFRSEHVPAAPILNVAEGLELAENLGLKPIAFTGERQVPTVRNPIEFAASTVDYSQAPPRLGEDRDTVLRWLESGRGGGSPQ